MPDYLDLYTKWQNAPETYWRECANLIDWDSVPDRIFDNSIGPYGAWFPDARLNTSYNCLDRHVKAGNGSRVALIWDSPMEGRVQKLTYAEALGRVEKIAGALANLGVVKGDRVVLYMPMVPEAALSMLACARLGAIHSMVFGGFAASELAVRISDAKPKVVIAASCGLEPNRVVAYKPMVDAAIELATHKPAACLIFQRSSCEAVMTPGRDYDFIEAEAAASSHSPASVAATDPLYILYTSGTTGRPKGVVRDNGGHAVALAQTMQIIFGIGAGDVMWAASDVGWVVGHSYIVYAPLLVGATSIIYEGKPVGTPDPGEYWRVVSQHRVKTMFTAPTALRAIRQQDPEGNFIAKYDHSCLQALFLGGERCDPPTAVWINDLLRTPIIDNYWQTETGSPITARFLGLGLSPFKPGSGGRPAPGYDIQPLNDAGDVLPEGTVGNLCVKLPLPPGCGPTLWQNEEGYRAAYLDSFPGWYRTGDVGMRDDDGDVWVMGRTDDVINVAGHRLSTGAMEEVLAAHPDVAECAVISRADALKGDVPFGLVVLKSGANRDPREVEGELVALMREKIGPVAAFRNALVVPRLPKTRSGKILRATISKIVSGETVTIPGTIEDPAVLDQITQAFAQQEQAKFTKVAYGTDEILKNIAPKEVIGLSSGIKVEEEIADPVILERKGAVAYLTLNRPDVGNAFDAAMARALLEAAIECDIDPAIRCLVIRGHGRMFCVGGDVGQFHAAGAELPALLKEITTYLHAAIFRLARMEKPVITAIHGAAAGAGVALAAVGDIALAEPNAHFTLAYSRIGLSPDGGATWLLPRLVGLRRAQELALSNRRVLAEEAAAIGLITRVVAKGALESEVDALAKNLVHEAVGAIGRTKVLLLDGATTRFEAQLEAESRSIAAQAATAESQVGITAFVERQKPDFLAASRQREPSA